MGSSLVFAALSVALGVEPVSPPVPAADPLTLQWSAPAQCPDEAAVRKEIERLLAETEAPRPQLKVSADVTGDEGAYELVLEIAQADTTGRRQLEAASCQEAVEATALFVAIAIDPNLRIPEPKPESVHSSGPADAGTSGTESETVRSSGPAGAGTSGSEPESETNPESESEPGTRRWRGVGFVRGGAAVALVPGWSGFVQAGGGIAWRRVEVHAVGSGWLPRTASAGDVTGRVQMWTAGLQGCPILRPTQRISVALCAGLHAGAMLGRGLAGLDGGQRRSSQPWFGASLDPGVRVRVQRWVSLRAGAHMFVSLVRPAFDTEQGRLVHRADPVGGAFTLGIVVGRTPG